MSETALIPLRDALYAATHADPVLRDHISGRGVYLGKAPPGSSPGYLVIGPVIVDTADPYYNGRDGRRHRRRLTAWARTQGGAEEMYARLVALLDGQVLSLDGGHTMQQSALAWQAGPFEMESPKPATGDPRKPTALTLWGVQMDWTVKTVVI